MTPEEYVGYELINATAVSAIIGAGSAAACWHDLRPVADTLPSINYYQVGGGLRVPGFDTVTFSVSCRAATPAGARDLAREVMTVFGGTSGTGIHGTVNGFDVARLSLKNDNGLIMEPEADAYNAPIDITLVYAISTIS